MFDAMHTDFERTLQQSTKACQLRLAGPLPFYTRAPRLRVSDVFEGTLVVKWWLILLTSVNSLSTSACGFHINGTSMRELLCMVVEVHPSVGMSDRSISWYSGRM